MIAFCGFVELYMYAWPADNVMSMVSYLHKIKCIITYNRDDKIPTFSNVCIIQNFLLE